MCEGPRLQRMQYTYAAAHAVYVLYEAGGGVRPAGGVWLLFLLK